MRCGDCRFFEFRYKRNETRWGVCKKFNKPVNGDETCNVGELSEETKLFDRVMQETIAKELRKCDDGTK